MNHALLVGFWRQRAASPFRLALLAFVVGLPLLPLLVMPQMGLAPLNDVKALILIVVAGAIGQDVSSGVLQLLFARPIRRSEYVLCRWTGASLAAIALCVFQIAVAFGLLAARGAAPPAASVLEMAGEHVLMSVGLCAVIVLFSSILNGIADVGLWVIGSLTATIVGVAGSALQRPWLARVGKELERVLTPTVSLGFLSTPGSIPWFDIASYLSTITLCLALAIMAVNRKELSYATG